MRFVSVEEVLLRYLASSSSEFRLRMSSMNACELTKTDSELDTLELCDACMFTASDTPEKTGTCVTCVAALALRLSLNTLGVWMSVLAVSCCVPRDEDAWRCAMGAVSTLSCTEADEALSCSVDGKP
jgi:hypothetical protein